MSDTLVPKARRDFDKIWFKAVRKGRKIPAPPEIDPVRHYWLGFDPNGKERWFIELSNGRVISSLDDNYAYWLRKYRFLRPPT